jgi:hypothetical protein
MIGALRHIMIRAMAPALHSNAQWTLKNNTTANLPTDIRETRDTHRVTHRRSSSSVNRSRSTSQTHFAPTANRMASHSGLTQELLRLANRHSRSRCQISQTVSLDRRDLV